MEKTCCQNCIVAHIHLCLLFRLHHLTRIQFVFSLILLVIAWSGGIHHYLQTLFVMSILLLCSLTETQENCGVLHMHIAHTYVYHCGRHLLKPWHHSWVTEMRAAAVQALDVSLSLPWLPALLMSSTRVAQLSQLHSLSLQTLSMFILNLQSLQLTQLTNIPTMIIQFLKIGFH